MVTMANGLSMSSIHLIYGPSGTLRWVDW